MQGSPLGLDQPVDDGIAQFGDITDGGKQFQLQCGMARTDVIEQYRHVFFEVTALRHEQGCDADTLMTGCDEFGDGISQRRFLELQEGQADSKIGAGGCDAFSNGAEGFRPFGVASAVRE